MIWRDKKVIVFLLISGIYFILLSVFFISKNQTEAGWFSNWFYDKFFVFQFSIIYLIGCSFIEKYFNYMSFPRFGSRNRLIRKQFYEQCYFALAYISILFACIISGAILQFRALDSYTILNILQWYLRYLMGLFCLSLLAMILKRAKIIIIRNSSFFAVFLLLALELLVLIPGIRKTFPFDINIMFSWIFYKGIFSYIILAVNNFILAVYLFRVSSHRDLFV